MNPYEKLNPSQKKKCKLHEQILQKLTIQMVISKQEKRCSILLVICICVYKNMCVCAKQNIWKDKTPNYSQWVFLALGFLFPLLEWLGFLKSLYINFMIYDQISQHTENIQTKTWTLLIFTKIFKICF